MLSVCDADNEANDDGDSLTIANREDVAALLAENVKAGDSEFVTLPDTELENEGSEVLVTVSSVECEKDVIEVNDRVVRGDAEGLCEGFGDTDEEVLADGDKLGSAVCDTDDVISNDAESIGLPLVEGHGV